MASSDVAGGEVPSRRSPSQLAVSRRRAGSAVLCVGDVDGAALRLVIAGLGMDLVELGADQPVPGSYWGSSEAGLKGRRLFVRPDTPVHSALHEAAHFACMDETRRACLDTDAGGDVDEECAVCALQVLLADRIPHIGAARMLHDMDAWGYSFRLGSALRWWVTDASDAREWLARRSVAADLLAGVVERVPT